VRSDGFTVTTQFGDITHTQQWACKPEGLQAVDLSGAIAMALSTLGIPSELTTSNPTGVTLPATLTPGMQWNYGFNIQGSITYEGQEVEASGTVLTDLQESGPETVTVPAGTFESQRIQANSNFDLSASALGFEIPVDYTTTATLSYAPGIGLVRLTETNNLEGNAFSSTTELQFFNIP
jgi:hypothetical protein